MTLDESTGLVLKKMVAPGPEWLIYRVVAKSLVSFSPCGSPVRRGGVVSGSRSRDAMYCHIVPDLPVFPICIGPCWSLFSSRLPSDILLFWLEGSVPPAFRHDVRHGFLRNPVLVAEVPDAPPNAIRVGKYSPDFLS